ncbi:hypothetical protein TSMEX_001179 [Taenia solium]|eukprot:TsM_000595800 transcript=TsM_000595800 gene=TsM_000595800
MCGVCRDPNCSSSCVDALEKTLNLFSESLKESYASTRGDVVLEFGFRIRSLRSRGDDLIRELETKSRQNLLTVERLLGLLEFAKSCDQCDRNRILMHISEQLKTKLRFDKEHQFCPRFSFRCDKLGLEEAIAHYEVPCYENEIKSADLLPGESVLSWHVSGGVLEKDFANSFEKHRNYLKSKSFSGNTDSESFEMLECSPSSNCSYNYHPSDKSGSPQTEAQTSLFPESSISSWLLDACSSSSTCEKGDRIFPTIDANPSSWLFAERVGSERTQGNSSAEDLGAKMAALVLKHDVEKRADDIESTPLVRCKFVNGEPLCKRLGGCAIQMASDAMLMSTKPYVRTWVSRHTPLSEQKSDPKVNHLEPDAPDASVVVNQLREIGATDCSMWLSAKSCYETASNPSAERALLEEYHEQSDDWKDK